MSLTHKPHVGLHTPDDFAIVSVEFVPPDEPDYLFADDVYDVSVRLFEGEKYVPFMTQVVFVLPEAAVKWGWYHHHVVDGTLCGPYKSPRAVCIALLANVEYFNWCLPRPIVGLRTLVRRLVWPLRRLPRIEMY